MLMEFNANGVLYLLGIYVSIVADFTVKMATKLILELNLLHAKGLRMQIAIYYYILR